MNWKIKIVFVCLLMLVTYKAQRKPIPEMDSVVKSAEKKPDYHIVKVTMYTIDPKQTDSTPLETASGFMLDSINPKKHRVIAVSHDLKKEMKWGQKVRVSGIGKWDGIYVVRDLMNKRFKKRIDILINPGEKDFTFTKAKLYKL